MPISDAQIEPLTLSDPDGALALSTAIGWNQRAEDWRMLLRIAPSGSFAAVADGRVVGTAIGIDYGRFGWIAMMLVDPAYRGRGLGARLLERAMTALPPTLPIRLDATPLGRPLYRRFGFEDDVVLSRHVADAPAGGHLAAPLATGAPIRPLTAAELPSVTELDTHVFGGDRRRVIEWMMAWLPALCMGCTRQPGAATVPASAEPAWYSIRSARSWPRIQTSRRRWLEPLFGTRQGPS